MTESNAGGIGVPTPEHEEALWLGAFPAGMQWAEPRPSETSCASAGDSPPPGTRLGPASNVRANTSTRTLIGATTG